MSEKIKTKFDLLNAIDVSGKTEQKKTGSTNLTYLSWAWAWTELKKVCPHAVYEIKKFNGLPYVEDEKTGYMVFTAVTIDEMTHEMWLPVMDGANKAMKSKSYTYKVKGWQGKADTEKTVEACTMFDVNKTIMRCLTKNLAMFGLGLCIYAGEDLPEEDEEKPKKSSVLAEKSHAKKEPTLKDRYDACFAYFTKQTDRSIDILNEGAQATLSKANEVLDLLQTTGRSTEHKALNDLISLKLKRAA